MESCATQRQRTSEGRWMGMGGTVLGESNLVQVMRRKKYWPANACINGLFCQNDVWETHGDNFNCLRNRLLPVFDQVFSALLNDLAGRGTLNETLVVAVADVGRTPKFNRAAGRDHDRIVCSVVLAGGGIGGGPVYDGCDVHVALPATNPCGRADIHATLFHALGTSAREILHDLLGRPFPVRDGKV